MKFDISYREGRDLYRVVRTMRLQMKRKDYAGDFIQRVEDLEARLYAALDYMEALSDRQQPALIGESHPKASVPEGGGVVSLEDLQRKYPPTATGRPPLAD